MDVFQCPDTAVDSMRKNTVAATMEMEMIQKEMATPSFGCKKASAGLSTGLMLDIGAPMAVDDLKVFTTRDLFVPVRV